MSAPDTNIKTQEKRHKGPLSGMVLAVVIAALMFLALILWLAWSGNDPGDEGAQQTLPATSESVTDAISTEDSATTAPVAEPVAE